jgi:hypothetical protein
MKLGTRVAQLLRVVLGATWDGVACEFDTVAAQVGDLDGFGSQYPLRSATGVLSRTVSNVYET